MFIFSYKYHRTSLQSAVKSSQGMLPGKHPAMCAWSGEMKNVSETQAMEFHVKYGKFSSSVIHNNLSYTSPMLINGPILLLFH